MDIFQFDLATLAAKVRSGQLSFEAIMQVCAERYQTLEAELNAYKTWDGERALETARMADQLLKNGYDLGPLMGLPVSVKDMFAVPGMPTFAGSASELGDKWQAPGPLIQALLSQLGLVTGKTHTVEFALGGIGINAHWGTPKNPWDSEVHRVPGGSSSGAGVSLCQGSALLALGTDTAGSVRIPAAMTGMVGLKTTAGRWPTQQVVPLSSTLDTPGLLARSVSDVAYGYTALQSVLQGEQVTVPPQVDCRGLRIGVVENFFWDDAAPEVIECVNNALRELERSGAVLVPMQLADCDSLFALFQQGGLSVAELAAYLETHMPDKLAMLDPVVRARIEDGGAVSAREYLQRRELLEQAAVRAAESFQQVDVWLHPTLPITAPTISELEDLDSYRTYNMLALRNPSMANLMGLCALSMPAGLDSQGLPIGLQLTAAAYQETRLLAIAQAVDRVLGRRVPTVCQ